MKEPIILIPGIQGTTLANVNKTDFDKVWSGIRKFFDNLYDLLLMKDGITDEKADVVIERQDVEDLAYSEILNFLRNRGFNTYIFGYDWRKSNIHNGKELGKYIDLVITKNTDTGKKSKVNIITHSMGALVFSGYLKSIKKEEISSTINRVIFTVPPFLGSLEAMFNLVIGRSKLFNTSDDFRKIARTFPAVFELCPVYPGSVSFVDENKAFNIYNYENWQQDPTKEDAAKIKEQYEIRLKSLKEARSENDRIFNLADLPDAVRRNMLIIAGIGEQTQKKLEVDNTCTDPINKFVFKNDNIHQDNYGDGTVHQESAFAFKDSIKTISIKSRWLETRLDGRLLMHDFHSFFLNNGRVQNVIKRFLEFPKSKLKNDWYKSVGGDVELVNEK